ncbi:hypothetical protein Tco_0693094 [Tanacetum coccineum]
MKEVEKVNEWRDVMLLKTGYQLDYALPILIHLGNTSGYTFASDYNPSMVPPYPYSTTPSTSMENVPNVVVEHVKEPLNDEGVGDECGGNFEVRTSSLAGISMGNQEKQVVSRFSGAKKRASYRLEYKSTESDDSEQSKNDDDINTGDDMDEE